MADPVETTAREPVPKGYPITLPVPRHPERIATLRAHIAEKHPSTLDFCDRFADPEDPVTADLLRRIAAWPVDEIAIRAYEIPGSQMDRLLRVFVVQTDPALRDRIDTILQARMKRRFCTLVWQLLQDRCDDPALLSLLFSGASGRRAFRAGQEPGFFAFFRAADRQSGKPLPERVYLGLIGSGLSIDRYFEQLDIPPDEDLAIQVLSRFFTSCPKEAFRRERTSLARLFGILRLPFTDDAKEARIADLLAPALGHILLESEPPDYESDLLRNIVPRFGPPHPSSLLWSQLDDAQRMRFNQWMHLDRLQAGLIGRRQKIRILGTLYPYIDNVIAEPEAGLLFIYFNKFVLVDRAEEPDVMLLYPRKLFSQTYDLYRQQQTAREEAIARVEQFRAEVLPEPAVSETIPEEPDDAGFAELSVDVPEWRPPDMTGILADVLGGKEPDGNDGEGSEKSDKEMEAPEPEETADTSSSSSDRTVDGEDPQSQDSEDSQNPENLASAISPDRLKDDYHKDPQSQDSENLASAISPDRLKDEPVRWPVNQEILTMARIAILETRTERDRRQTLAATILRGTCERIVHLRFEDTPILYARQFLYDLLG